MEDLQNHLPFEEKRQHTSIPNYKGLQTDEAEAHSSIESKQEASVRQEVAGT